jgi:hypothetical protein
MNSGEENFGELVVACGDSSIMLEFIEEALDEVTFAVEREIASPRRLTIGFWRNHRGDSSLRESVDQRISVVSLIAKQGIWIGAVDQLLRTSQIVGLSRRQHQFDRIAQGIDEHVDFGRQSAAGSADRLRPVFFRAPALC